ncbi:GyrI-like domain-containing protein [Actibacterium sp. 188UL27-1]|uniref:AraC family transcriptional regulator n=1 Tax=Actibacterium sp. 188UL27-1 TaxID=2786961 RepID=UPI001EF69441|nr:AraC family transcriptional regulator [Actibacterium sp. 188UL27-1]
MARYEDRILRVLNYIHDNPGGNLSLDTLADVAAMSRFHWHRVFHAMTGETCAQATRRIRLHRGACWLVQTQGEVSEIARKCGYENTQSFVRAFREKYGLTPAAFRSRGALQPPVPNDPKGTKPMYPIEIIDQPMRRLAALPHTGPYMEIGKGFETLGTIITSRNLWSHAYGMVGVYYDDPDATSPADLKSHAGVAVDEAMEIADPLTELRLTGGRYAVMHYKGPYSGLRAAYGYMYGTWLPKSGADLGDQAPIEVYLNSPMDTAPDDLLTDVCVSVR